HFPVAACSTSAAQRKRTRSTFRIGRDRGDSLAFSRSLGAIVSAGMTRRRFNTWMAFSAVTSAASRSLPAWALDTAPIAWASDDPHLTGNFVSIGPEIEACDLQVISGRIPADLEGVYMRNGPNPRLRPIVYAYPMDGDGMIHAVYLKNGRAR